MFDLSKQSKEIAILDAYIKESEKILETNNDYLIQGQIQKIKNEFGFECSLDNQYIASQMGLIHLSNQNKLILVMLINRLKNECAKIEDKYSLAKRQMWIYIICAIISMVGAIISVGVNIVFNEWIV